MTPSRNADAHVSMKLLQFRKIQEYDQATEQIGRAITGSRSLVQQRLMETVMAQETLGTCPRPGVFRRSSSGLSNEYHSVSKAGSYRKAAIYFEGCIELSVLLTVLSSLFEYLPPLRFSPFLQSILHLRIKTPATHPAPTRNSPTLSQLGLAEVENR